MEKEKCIIFGNCHCSGVRKFLEYSNFYDKYDIHQFANWELINSNEHIPTKLLRTADLVIYQPLSDVYNCFSTNKKNDSSFLHLLPEKCNTISLV